MLSKLGILCISMILISMLQLLLYVTNEHEVDGWDKYAIKNFSHYETDELIKIIPNNFCKNRCMLLILVTSAPSNVNERQAIRDTWGNAKKLQGHNISLTFFVGNSLNPSVQDEILTERDKYDDIIQENFIDTYYNLTLKSIFAMKIVATNCNGNVQFLLKIDDDMFLQVPTLIEMITARNKSENILVGKMTCNAHPIKNPFSKWYCPAYMYNKSFYPNFLSGTSYLMSMDTTRKLYNAAIVTPLMHLEDVFLTGICAQMAGIHPEYNAGFTTGSLFDEPCQLKNLITMHQFSPTRMRNTFNNLNDNTVIEKCTTYEKMFNVVTWMQTTLFMPSLRLSRKRICT